MNLRDRIDIVIITYNRREYLKTTFEQLFSISSPVRNYDITVIDNNSDDGTKELLDDYCGRYNNLSHIINNVNIGGCANYVKAVTEVAKKDYVWVLCDNDTYDWTSWTEVENAINNNSEVIITRNCKNTPAEIFYTATLVSAVIFKRSIITPNVAENLYFYTKYLFPQLSIVTELINRKRPFFIVQNDLVHSGINPEHDKTFVRGVDTQFMPESRKNLFWSVGYFNTLELIVDKKTRYEIIDGTRHYHKSLFDLFKTIMVKNKIQYGNYFYNFTQIFRILNFKQKLKFIFAFLVINLSLKDYSFYELRSKLDWEKYFEKVKEQKYLDKLAKKLNGKRVLIYGAGIISEILFEKYDLSGFNIAGIADKRFERTNEKEFLGIKAIKPDEIKSTEFDYILFTLKLYKRIQKILKDGGVNKKTLSLIKKEFKYAIRN